MSTKEKFLVWAFCTLLTVLSGITGWWVGEVQDHIDESVNGYTRLKLVEKSLQDAREDQIIYQMWTARRVKDKQYLEFLADRLNQIQSERKN